MVASFKKMFFIVTVGVTLVASHPIEKDGKWVQQSKVPDGTNVQPQQKGLGTGGGVGGYHGVFRPHNYGHGNGRGFGSDAASTTHDLPRKPVDGFSSQDKQGYVPFEDKSEGSVDGQKHVSTDIVVPVYHDGGDIPSPNNRPNHSLRPGGGKIKPLYYDNKDKTDFVTQDPNTDTREPFFDHDKTLSQGKDHGIGSDHQKPKIEIAKPDTPTNYEPLEPEGPIYGGDKSQDKPSQDKKPLNPDGVKPDDKYPVKPEGPHYTQDKYPLSPDGPVKPSHVHPEKPVVYDLTKDINPEGPVRSGEDKYPVNPEGPISGGDKYPVNPEGPISGGNKYPVNPEGPISGGDKYPVNPEGPISSGDKYPEGPISGGDKYPEGPISGGDKYPVNPEGPISSGDKYPEGPISGGDKYPEGPISGGDKYPVNPEGPIGGGDKYPVNPEGPIRGGDKYPVNPEGPIRGGDKYPVNPEGPIRGGDKYPVNPEGPIRGGDKYPVKPEGPISGGDNYPVIPEGPIGGGDKYPVNPDGPIGGGDQYPLKPEAPVNSGDKYPLNPEGPIGGEDKYPLNPEGPVNSGDKYPINPEGPIGGGDKYPLNPEGPVNSGDKYPVNPEVPVRGGDLTPVNPDGPIPDETYPIKPEGSVPDNKYPGVNREEPIYSGDKYPKPINPIHTQEKAPLEPEDHHSSPSNPERPVHVGGNYPSKPHDGGVNPDNKQPDAGHVHAHVQSNSDTPAQGVQVVGKDEFNPNQHQGQDKTKDSDYKQQSKPHAEVPEKVFPIPGESEHIVPDEPTGPSGSLDPEKPFGPPGEGLDKKDSIPKQEFPTMKDLCQSLDLKRFLTLINRAEMGDIFNSKGPITIFAPSDAAFSKLPVHVYYRLTRDNAFLKQVLKYHIIEGVHPENGETDEKLEGVRFYQTEEPKMKIFFNSYGGNYYVNGLPITKASQRASNGMIHVIDNVLYPLPSKNMAETMQATTTFTRFYALAQEAGLFEDELHDLKGPHTIFVPSDAAFAKLPRRTLEWLTFDKPALKTLLLKHIVPGAHFSSWVPDTGLSYSTMNPDIQIQIKREKDHYTANGVRIGNHDIVAQDGVIHSINEVLFTKDLQPKVEYRRPSLKRIYPSSPTSS